MANVAINEKVRVYPQHWPEGQSCLCEITEIDPDADGYVRVREIDRPQITFLILKSAVPNLESK